MDRHHHREKIEEWQTLCKLMGRNELVEDDRFSDMEKLRANHNDVDRAISAWTVDKDPIQLFHLLQKESITAGPIMHEAHAFADPHVKEREFFQEVTAPELGTHLNPTTTFKLSKVPFPKLKPPVRLGEDNDYVYQGSAEDIGGGVRQAEGPGPDRHGLRAARDVGA